MTWDRRTAMMALISVIVGRATEPLAITREGFVPGQLTVDLGQWAAIVVKYKGKSIEILPEQVYTELARSD